MLSAYFSGAGLALALLLSTAALPVASQPQVGQVLQYEVSAGPDAGSEPLAERRRSSRLPFAVKGSSGNAVETLHSQFQHSTSASRPLQSSLEPVNQTLTATHVEQRDFYIFHDVYLQNDSLLYFHLEDNSALPADLPPVLRLSRYEVQIELPIIIVNSSNRDNYPQTCSRHTTRNKPALLFSGTPWDSNIFEFFGTVMMPLFQTATMSGLLHADRIQILEKMSNREQMLAELHNPTEMAPFALIAGRPFFYGTPWSYLINALTTEQLSLQLLSGSCWKTLVVSEDGVLRFLYERVVEMRDETYRDYRAEWLGRFQQHLIAAEKVHLRTFEQPWPASIGDAGVVLKRPRVTIASRPPNRRAILNENEIVSHLTNNWDVNVTVTNFRMSLASAIALMQETDVLLGMHGAGLTNAFWLKQGAVLIQLLPYGWEVHPGQLIRSCYSADNALANKGHYLQWVNPHSYNAWFNKGDYDRSIAEWDNHANWGPKVSNFSEQPNETTPLPKDPDSPHFWMYQNTWVDMHSFSPVLDKAMELVKASKRSKLRR